MLNLDAIQNFLRHHPDETRETAIYAITAYGDLLAYGVKYTPQALAALLAFVYNLDTPRNAVCYAALLATNGTIERNRLTGITARLSWNH